MSISLYINKYVSYVSHPYQPLDGLSFPDLPSLCKLFERFLALPENEQLASQITITVEDHQNLPFTDIGRRIANLRNLVLTIEPCLKAIGRTRYAKDLNKLNQLEKQNLRFILEHGLIFPKMYWDENFSNKKHCSVYWSQQDYIAAVAYRIYLLRNEFSHEAQSYSQEQVSVLFNTTIALFLLAVRHPPNRAVLELATSPYQAYLQWVSQHLDADYNRYVRLQASLKWKSSSVDEQPIYFTSTESFSKNSLPTGPEEITSLIKQIDRMILIGGSGAGKSRTLRHVTAILAKEILSLQYSPEQIPIYLPADILGQGNKLINYLSTFLHNISSNDIQSGLANGQYCFFLDGLNEVPQQYYREVIQDIKAFLLNHPKCRVVVSTRQEAYHQELPLPVYELESLTPYGVWQILRLNAKTEEEGNQLFSRIKNDNRLLALFKTPLMSRLLCELPTQIHIPRSIGEMMNVLVNQIFEREERKGNQIPRYIKIMALVDMAKTTRNESGTVVSENQIVHIFENLTQRFAREVSPISLLNTLIDSSLLNRRSDHLIGFFHETALDYFIALGLKDSWEKGFDSKVQANILAATRTSVEILSGLLNSADTLALFIAQKNLRLAAQCYSARSQRSKLLFQELFNQAKSLMLLQSIPSKCLAIESMAAFDEVEATQAIFKALPKLSNKTLSVVRKSLIQYAPNGVTKEVQKSLVSKEFTQQLIAIEFTIAHQLAEVTPQLISLAELRKPRLAHKIAQALGCLESPEALDYLIQQCNTSIENRYIPLVVAINALSSERSAALLKLALKDLDTQVRRAAISKIEFIENTGLDTEIFELVVNETDFLVRLIGTKILLLRIDKSQRRDLIRALFSVPPHSDESLQALRIINLINSLEQEELEDVALQALCLSHLGMQSLVLNKVLNRNPYLAVSIFDLINLEDPKITSGAKAALVKGLISAGYVDIKILEKLMSSSLPPGVRLAVVEMIEKLPHDIGAIVFQKALVDPLESVQIIAVKSIAFCPELLSEQVIEQIIFHPNRAVQKQGWRLINQQSFFENTKLLNWVEITYPTYLRTRAIEELCIRRFMWTLHKVCDLVRDKDYGIRMKGYRILSAIYCDGLERVGQIVTLKVERGYGFIMPIDTKEKLFFHINDLIDRKYTPTQYDLVTFKIGKSNLANRKQTAIQVGFLC
ncbi:cold shock domain-containing protein [Nostoc flagelliforme FACHB-838]|uniref:Cold shock domain-containing protein n=1 Tax=Nostoc flagelliforme FACHB-838 TaxID=2692904 RepID=A0ABR8DV00_9NOSO|nr:cold shock domain-containing protein [Nostoc flagelliforme]MBD2533170.1 cold shock domain-containing protein [Nostoc flagelliforme FACHB-838]